jgi:hypothetical protein
VADLLQDTDRRRVIAEAAARFRATHRGSLAATLAGISDLLPQASAEAGLSPGSGSSPSGTR